jgi:DNA-binding NtrC family response regulator
MISHPNQPAETGEPRSGCRAAVAQVVARDPELKARFKVLVQSSLRAGLVRHLHARPAESYDVESLMQTFGCMRQDIEACMDTLGAGGLVRVAAGPARRFSAERPTDEGLAGLLSEFLAATPSAKSEDQAPSVQRFREMIGRDEKMMLVFESIKTVSKTDLSVLITGPTGSGKEVVARIIHELSRRKPYKFQAVNCAALPDTLFESEVFGHERGAFTGAHERKPGKIELANQGTLFLDELGDLSPIQQPKLLRVLEERRVERLGGRQAIEVDFRLISATNRPLDLLVSENRFREDLYYRINAFAIRLPALRERPVDIPLLAERFLARYCAGQGQALDAKTFSPEAMSLLKAYPWPGNIRELESTVSRAALSAAGSMIRREDIQFLHAYVPVDRPADQPVPSLLEVEVAHIQKVLELTGWNKKRTARLLHISRETLYRKIAEHNLRPAREALGAALAS